MRHSFETWSRNLWIWLLPVIFLAINLLLLTVYQTRFASRRDSLENISGRAGQRLESLRAYRGDLQQFITQFENQQQAIESIYNQHFATEAERFTSLLREVRQLARQAGLAPDSFGYPKEELEEEGLVRRNVAFSVAGNYEQVRRLINFLELSDQFITLEKIDLSGDAGTDRLDIGLSLSSLFIASDEELQMAKALAASARHEAEQAAREAGNEDGGGEDGETEAGDGEAHEEVK